MKRRIILFVAAIVWWTTAGLTAQNSSSSFNTFVRYEAELEKKLQNRGMPIELKYLPAALSGMNPSFKQQERAGIWSLPLLVALRAGLTVTETHDERYIFSLATETALNYLSELYDKYGNWWSAILAYSNSPAAYNRCPLHYPKDNTLHITVQLWEYYKNSCLPNVEVIPAFVTFSYIDKQTEREHLYFPDEPDYVQVAFESPLDLELLCNALNITEQEFAKSNPLFRSNPIKPLAGHTISLTQGQALQFEMQKEALYKATVEKEKKSETLLKESAAKSVTKKKTVYIVRSGDTLSRIAQKYRVRVSDIKKWNSLKSDRINIGQRLSIYSNK